MLHDLCRPSHRRDRHFAKLGSAAPDELRTGLRGAAKGIAVECEPASAADLAAIQTFDPQVASLPYGRAVFRTSQQTLRSADLVSDIRLDRLFLANPVVQQTRDYHNWERDQEQHDPDEAELRDADAAGYIRYRRPRGRE
jgi:hypothetical protein